MKIEFSCHKDAYDSKTFSLFMYLSSMIVADVTKLFRHGRFIDFHIYQYINHVYTASGNFS